ncbi:hypothetical protein GCM10007425_18100 [Lysinibacillus alkalisoli]|uniref:Helix-turn-helix domain-containing protein n=1 Tax=Lysinibacillus alkalisoli TaxID=1911548 RepID=A0A917G6A8_9BACI|nr:AraC family transcriptional regulator [Lysinibacillus alkalisoli]GGG24021.1 hypothetical protein GCM10007425_18100 [Lysinibacillus alkalisoli]
MYEQLQLWNQVTLHVLDIQVLHLHSEHELRKYIAPSSMFVFIANGQTEIWLEGEVSFSEHFQLIHVAKGQQLTVESAKADVYLVMYHAVLPSSALKEFHIMMQKNNPFMKNWSIIPKQPLELLNQYKELAMTWERLLNEKEHKTSLARSMESLTRLKIQGDFLRLVQLMLEERVIQNTKPTLVEQVLRYITQHFREPISIARLASQLNYTPQYITRTFKAQMGCSPSEYMMRLRMEVAKQILVNSAASLQEIASYIGYNDSLYFTRIFKKQVGIAPGEYRKNHANVVSKNTMNEYESSIVATQNAMYDLNINEINYHLISDGGRDMAMSKSLVTAALLCLTMVTTGCSTASETNKGGTSIKEEKQQTATASQSDMRTITTSMGDVEVAVEPKRVAAPGYLGTVLALGVEPIASDKFLMDSPYLEGMIDDVTNVDDSLEALTELEPDVIITHLNQPETVDKYKMIAPTIAMPYNSFESIQEEIRYFGDLLNKKEEAEKWIAQFEAHTNELKQQVQDALGNNETVSIMQEYDGKVFLFGSKSGRGGRIMYEILGANPPADVPEHMLKESYYEFSLEMLPQYTGDYLVLTTKSTLEELQADPIWGQLPAVQQGNVYLWTESESWFRDPIAVEAQIDDLAKWIIDVAKK